MPKENIKAGIGGIKVVESTICGVCKEICYRSGTKQEGKCGELDNNGIGLSIENVGVCNKIEELITLFPNRGGPVVFEISSRFVIARRKGDKNNNFCLFSIENGHVFSSLDEWKEKLGL